MAAISDLFDGMHGVIFPFSGTAAPTGFLMCYGQAVSRTTYAALFAVSGTTFGAGDGSTTFNVPDLRGCVIAGKDNMGGTAAGRLTGVSGSVAGTTLGATGGQETHVIAAGEMPVHNHGVTDPGHTHTTTFGSISSGGSLPYISSAAGSSSTGEASQSSTTSISTQTAGSGSAHNNVQPTFIMNYIVKT